jgi:hypothetical protein
MIQTASELIASLQEYTTGKGRRVSGGFLIASDDPLAAPGDHYMKYEPNDRLIVTIWSRHDFPNQWDALMNAWRSRNDDMLCDVQREVLIDLLPSSDPDPDC